MILLILGLLLGFPFVLFLGLLGIGACDPPLNIIDGLVTAAGALLALRAVAALVAAVVGQVPARSAVRWTVRALSTFPLLLVLWNLGSCDSWPT